MMTTRENGSIVIVLSERFAHADISAYSSLVRQHLDSGNRNFIVDCSKLNFVDSTALGAMVSSLRSVKAEKGTLVLRNLRGNALRLFDDASLNRVFTIQESAGPSHPGSSPGASQAKLALSEEIHDNLSVFHVSGIITWPDGASLLKESFLLEIQQKRNLILDLEGVFLIDSASIGDLLSLNQLVADAGIKLILCNARGYVNEIFDNLNLSRILRICGGLSEAVSEAKGG